MLRKTIKNSLGYHRVAALFCEFYMPDGILILDNTITTNLLAETFDSQHFESVINILCSCRLFPSQAGFVFSSPNEVKRMLDSFQTCIG